MSDAHAEARARLLAEIAAEFRDTAEWTGRPVASPRLLAALARVPRHEFVGPAQRHLAYENAPLAIGHGQTISQPFIVAIMSELADIGPEDRVLEIGTGCGYQAAVLAELAARVCSVEVIPALSQGAAERLARLGYADVALRVGDGWAGWPEEAPFDAIVVTAAAATLPEVLVAQLAPGGRMVIPIGPAGYGQTLELVTKDAAERLTRRALLPVAFVPMVHGG